MFYITMTPYLPCNNNNINRKELYDFYYTAITLTTGYKCTYNFVSSAQTKRDCPQVGGSIMGGSTV